MPPVAFRSYRGVSPYDANGISGREVQHFGYKHCERGVVIRSAVGKSILHDDGSGWRQFELCAKNFLPAATTTRLLKPLLEEHFTFVVSHVSGMMLGHRHADSLFETTRGTACHFVSVFPMDSLRTFLKHLNGREGVIGQ